MPAAITSSTAHAAPRTNHIRRWENSEYLIFMRAF
jgi:hypothetical protein